MGICSLHLGLRRMNISAVARRIYYVSFGTVDILAMTY
jgi:hypothetical protein